VAVRDDMISYGSVRSPFRIEARVVANVTMMSVSSLAGAWVAVSWRRANLFHSAMGYGT
jgi:hypothetical protein